MIDTATTYPLVECVLNISEGRDSELLEDIKEICTSAEQCHILHMDVGYDANRTVFTLGGNLRPLFFLLEQILKYATEHLDIREHQGIHPRIGILDVIPFIPLANITIEQLQDEVQNFSAHISQKYNLPLFYYGSMSHSGRRSLHFLRGSGLPWLRQEIGKTLLSDAGPQKVHERLGASCVTVRRLMLAYNINLGTTDLVVAKKIARDLIKMRESSTPNDHLDISQVKFLAWSTPQYNCCQISTNIYNLDKVTMVELFQLVQMVAGPHGVDLTGSELIGLSPLRGITRDSSELTSAIDLLGLDSVRTFDLDTHVLEYQLARLSLTGSTT